MITGNLVFLYTPNVEKYNTHIKKLNIEITIILNTHIKDFNNSLPQILNTHIKFLNHKNKIYEQKKTPRLYSHRGHKAEFQNLTF